MAMSQQMFPRLRVATTSEKELRTAISLSGEEARLDLRQCSSSPTVELSLKSGRGTTMNGTVNTGQCLTPHVQEGRHGSRLLHTPQGLHWVWIWPLCGRHCLHRLLRFLFINKCSLFIFSLKVCKKIKISSLCILSLKESVSKYLFRYKVHRFFE